MPGAVWPQLGLSEPSRRPSWPEALKHKNAWRVRTSSRGRGAGLAILVEWKGG